MALNETNVSNYSTPSSPSLEEISLSILTATWKPNLVVSVFSLAGVVTNTLVMTTIAKTKSLHNKSQFVIFSHSLAEAVFVFFGVIVSFRKFLLASIGMPDVIGQVSCIFFLMPFIIASKAALYAITALCVDRLLAIGLPIRYKNLRPMKYVFCVNALCWGLELIHVPFFFLNSNSATLLPMCQFGYAISINYRSNDAMESNGVIFCTVIAYSIAIGIVSFRYWGKKWQNEAQRSTWARQMQMGAFRMMMTVGCLYFVLWGISQGITYVLMNYTNPITTVTFAPYVTLLQNFNTASHFFVYFALSKSFRKAFFGWFPLRLTNTVVEPITHTGI